jgi:hypothetical protein
MIQQTSLNSYQELLVRDMLNSGQDDVYSALMILNSATDREICEYLQLGDPNKVRPRRFELCELGLVGEDCKRKCSITGKTVISWKILNTIINKKVSK